MPRRPLSLSLNLENYVSPSGQNWYAKYLSGLISESGVFAVKNFHVTQVTITHQSAASLMQDNIFSISDLIDRETLIRLYENAQINIELLNVDPAVTEAGLQLALNIALDTMMDHSAWLDAFKNLLGQQATGLGPLVMGIAVGDAVVGLVVGVVASLIAAYIYDQVTEDTTDDPNADPDGDGIINRHDGDDDGDGHPDKEDAYPYDPYNHCFPKWWEMIVSKPTADQLIRLAKLKTLHGLALNMTVFEQQGAIRFLQIQAPFTKPMVIRFYGR